MRPAQNKKKSRAMMFIAAVTDTGPSYRPWRHIVWSQLMFIN